MCRERERKREERARKRERARERERERERDREREREREREERERKRASERELARARADERERERETDLFGAFSLLKSLRVLTFRTRPRSTIHHCGPATLSSVAAHESVEGCVLVSPSTARPGSVAKLLNVPVDDCAVAHGSWPSGPHARARFTPCTFSLTGSRTYALLSMLSTPNPS
jgi:hypothetical protein